MCMFAEEEKQPPVSLYLKIIQIYERIQYIPKRGWNDFHKYHYPLEADINEACRVEMAKFKVVMIPTVVSKSLREVTTQQGKTEFIATVEMKFRFIDAETGQTEEIDMPGEGQDRGDKAIYKAISGAQKYALIKMFMIATGEDPEATTQTEREEQESSQKGQKQRGNRNTDKTAPRNDRTQQQQTPAKPAEQQKTPPAPQQTNSDEAKQRWIQAINDLNSYAEGMRLSKEEIRRHGELITGKAEPQKWSLGDIKKIKTSLETGRMPEPEQKTDGPLPADDDLPF